MTRQHSVMNIARLVAADPGASAAELATAAGIRPTPALALLRELGRHGQVRPFYVGPGRRATTAYRWWPSVAAAVHGRYPASGAVLELTDLAAAGGLRPEIGTHGRPNYRRVYRVYLNGEGRDSVFGALHVSAVTGRLLRANLCWGNAAQEYTLTKVEDVRRDLSSNLAMLHGHRGRR